MNKPTDPNISIPAEFASNGTKVDFPDPKILNGFDPINPDVLPGDCLNKFIDDTYKGLNYAMAGTDAINLIQEDEVLTYKDGELVSDKLANLKNYVTNCILEAPNGVATYSTSYATAKEGLKILLPNGRNADGTLKNIEYTLENDIVSNTLSGLSNEYKHKRTLYIGNNVAILVESLYIYIQNSEPSLSGYSGSYGVWYNPDTNKSYRSNAGSWVETPLMPISTCFCSGVTINDYTNFNSVNLLKQSDKSEISGWSMPSNKYINLTIGASGSTYTAPADGWYSQQCTVSVTAYNYFYMSCNGVSIQVVGSGDNQNIHSFIPVKKNNVMMISYTNVRDINLKFIYAEGEV